MALRPGEFGRLIPIPVVPVVSIVSFVSASDGSSLNLANVTTNPNRVCGLILTKEFAPTGKEAYNHENDKSDRGRTGRLHYGWM